MRLYLQTVPGSTEAPRYVQITLEQDLLGGWTLYRESGTQGGRATMKREQFLERDEAVSAFEKARESVEQALMFDPDHPLHHCKTRRRRSQFFLSRSFKTELSIADSASSLFSRLFSSSKVRSRAVSDTVMPPNFAFQL